MHVLKPFFFLTAMVVVVGLVYLATNDKEIVSISSCKNIEGSQEQCWLDLLELVFLENGLDATFDVFSQLHDAEPAFATSCHDFGHRLGEMAYGLFFQRNDFALTPKTSYCSYGFYHGFMESLLSETGDLRKTGEFCDYVDKKLAKKAPDATLQCFHGIGHGAIDISATEKNWGNEEAIIDSALKLCEEVSSTPAQASRCATGVFNGIAFLYINQPLSFSINKEGPLWFCHKQENYKRECYISMNVALLWLADDDFYQAAKFLEKIVEDDYANQAALNLAALMSISNNSYNDYGDMIRRCRSIQKRLHLGCIQGYAYGFLEKGTPGSEYIKAFDVCKSSILLKEEKDACFEYIFYYLNLWYPQKKARQICGTIKGFYKNLCYAQLERF